MRPSLLPHRTAGVTGDSEGAGNPPPFPLAVIDAKPGTSEAEYLRGVEWMDGVVTRYRKLRDDLAHLHAATGPPVRKKLVTVLTLVQFLGPDQDASPASLALVFDLLPPLAIKFYGNILRGTIAAAVAVLRSAEMDNRQIDQWLTPEIKRRALDFTAQDAVRWFYECSSGKVPEDTSDMFRAFRPAPSLSLTEAVAKCPSGDIASHLNRLPVGGTAA